MKLKLPNTELKQITHHASHTSSGQVVKSKGQMEVYGKKDLPRKVAKYNNSYYTVSEK